MNKALTDLLEQQRYFDALLQLGPLLEKMRAKRQMLGMYVNKGHIA